MEILYSFCIRLSIDFAKKVPVFFNFLAFYLEKCKKKILDLHFDKFLTRFLRVRGGCEQSVKTKNRGVRLLKGEAACDIIVIS